MGLFLTGVMQVTLVAINSYQIPHKKWVGALTVGFLISMIWTWNVKKIAFGDWFDRVAYASGAATGTGLGMLASFWWYE